MKILFISEGALYRQEDDRPPEKVESPFALEAGERADARVKKNAWKGQGREDQGVYSAGVVWGKQAMNRESNHALFRAVAASEKPGIVYYLMSMSASSGLFRLDLATGEELRIFHRQDFDGCALGCDRRTGKIILSSRNEEGLGKLEGYDVETRRRRPLTAGDGHDSNPCLDPRDPETVYFQSAGVARNEQGEIAAIGAAGVHRLDLKSGEMTTVIEETDRDFLSPKVDTAGNLWYIRRPHREQGHVSFAQRLKAWILFPVNLAAGIYGFLDTFTKIFAKRSLRPAGAAQDLEVRRSRYAQFQELAVSLEKVRQIDGEIDDSVQIVPATWELIRRTADGSESVVADHVVAFDFGPEGELVYSDGLRVWLHGQPRKRLVKGRIIQSVAVV